MLQLVGEVEGSPRVHPSLRIGGDQRASGRLRLGEWLFGGDRGFVGGGGEGYSWWMVDGYVVFALFCVYEVIRHL